MRVTIAVSYLLSSAPASAAVQNSTTAITRAGNLKWTIFLPMHTKQVAAGSRIYVTSKIKYLNVFDIIIVTVSLRNNTITDITVCELQVIGTTRVPYLIWRMRYIRCRVKLVETKVPKCFKCLEAGHMATPEEKMFPLSTNWSPDQRLQWFEG